jgi:hypothetical protein
LHCTTSETMKRGMNLEQITQLARCNGLHTMTFRPSIMHLEGLPEPKFRYLEDDLLNHQHDIHTHDN